MAQFRQRSQARDQYDPRGRVFGHDIPAGGCAVQFGHPIIYDHDIWLMAVVSLNGFQTRLYHRDNLVVAMTNQVRQGRAHAFLIVSNQYTHG